MRRLSPFVILMIGIYIIIFSALSILRHANFQTQTWDMAAYEDMLWNTVHGRVMMSRFEEIPYHLGVHFNLFLFFLVPLYALIPSAYTLLIIQTMALALGAWPLYFFAKRRLGNERLALLIAGAYLLYPSLHAVNLFDFHPIAFLVSLLLAALYFLETKHWRWAVFFLICSASVQEDAILAVAFVGVYWFTTQARLDGVSTPPSKGGDSVQRSFWSVERKIGAAIVLCALIYFLLAVKLIMPGFGGGLLRADRYANLGKTPSEFVQHIVRDPLVLVRTVLDKEKLSYLFWLFFPVAFLPFFSRRGLILLIPGLAENLLTSYGYQFNSGYQYDSMIIPALFFSSVIGLETLFHRYPKKSQRIERIVLAFLLFGFFARSPISPIRFHWSLYGDSDRARAFRQMLSLVPANASVSANTNLVPHLLNHKDIFMLGTEKKPADVVLIDAADGTGFKTTSAFQDYADRYTRSGAYDAQAVDRGGRFIVLKKRGL